MRKQLFGVVLSAFAVFTAFAGDAAAFVDVGF